MVRLAILPELAGPDGPVREVQLARALIRWNKGSIQTTVLDGFPGAPGGIGVITVWSFGRDTAAVRRQLQSQLRDLGRKQTAGILLDLRGNDDGSLADAAALCESFIGAGPIAQVKQRGGRVETRKVRAAGAAYTGPLAILVDHDSSGGAEALAAAIQDDQRGLLLGYRTSGRGHVEYAFRSVPDASGRRSAPGTLQVTNGVVYRVTGVPFEGRGVTPAITFTSMAPPAKPNATDPQPAESIVPAAFKPRQAGIAPDALAPVLVRHDTRMRTEPILVRLTERQQRLAEFAARTTRSLDPAQRQVQADQDAQWLANFETSVAASAPLRRADPAGWPEDAILRESAAILTDCIQSGCFPAR